MSSYCNSTPHKHHHGVQQDSFHFLLPPSSGLLITKVEAISSSETSVRIYQTKQYKITEDSHFHTSHHVDLKYHQLSSS
jgi:hypothetical protein